MNKKEQKIINDKFIQLINSIPNSYLYLENINELKDALAQIEIARVMLRKYARDYKENKISIETFKEVLINIATKETDQMIVVDENRNEISDEQKALQNHLAINAFNEEEIKEFATNLYRILSSARICVYHKFNPEATILVAGRDESSSLNVF